MSKTKECSFDKAWVGKCKNPVVKGSRFCKEHKGKKCKCGKQAVKECSDVLGPLVCGAYLCNKCTCNARWL